MNPFQTLIRRIGRWLRDQAGASLVEYAMLLALITVVSIAVVTLVGQNVSETFSCSNTEIANPGIRKVVQEKIKNGDTLDKLELKFTECI